MGKDYEEKTDPEFNKQLENPKPIKKEKETELNEGQLIIYDYIKSHIEAGIPLKKIEQTLEESKTQGNYTSLDISKAMKLISENQIMKKLKNIENHTSTASEESHSSSSNPNEQKFMDFLKKNPDHKLATTQIYKQVGLSARKGTETKNALKQKGLIKIEEIKYEKGWKKIIKLT
jgi:hypothetical protein